MNNHELEDIAIDLLSDYRDDRKARRAAAEKPENLTVDQRYEAEIAAAQKRLNATQSKMNDDDEAGRPINVKLFDQRESRRARVEELENRFKAEVEERDRFVRNWLEKAKFGLRFDALQAWESARLEIAARGINALLEDASKHPLYSGGL